MEERRSERSNNTYRVLIYEIDCNTKEEKQIHDYEHSTVCMLADDAHDDNHMCEVMMNDNIHGLAEKIASSHKFSVAAKLAVFLMDLKNNKMSEFEDLLAEALSNEVEGGIQ